jgi:hypothetical protein
MHAPAPKIDCDQKAMGLLPLVMTAVFLTANFGKTWASRSNVWDACVTPLGIKRAWNVCITPILFVR